MTGFLLDTHVFIWLATSQSHRIRPSALKALNDSANACYLSAITVVEVEVKTALGKLTMPSDWESMRQRSELRWLDFSHAHAQAMARLPILHRDPFDRMLAAQALASDLTLVTADEILRKYPIKTLAA